MASTTLNAVLSLIRESGTGGIEAQDVVDKLGAAKATVTRFLKVLEADGLIRRDAEKRIYPVLRRGRRLVATEERDERVFELVEDSGENGISVQEVADKLEVEGGLAYQSVYRLRELGRIYRVGITRTARWRSHPRAA